MCFCTDIAAQSKFDAGRILLKSGDDGGRGGCKRDGNVSRKNRGNSDKSRKKSNLGETHALSDHSQHMRAVVILIQVVKLQQNAWPFFLSTFPLLLS